MVARIAPLAVVVLVLVVACYDDPLEVLRPDGARPSHASDPPVASGIFNRAEAFVAGNPMGNFAGGDPYNFGYYSTGPDSATSDFDLDRARIAIPHDSLITELSNFSFETWIRPSYSTEWQYGLIAMNSTHQFTANGRSDLGYFLIDYFHYSPGLMEINWSVASYDATGWSTVYAAPPPLHPDSGAELHVVGVHDNNVISLYINGQLAVSEDISGHSGLPGPNLEPTTGSGFRQDLRDIHTWSDSLRPLMIGGSQYQEGDTTHYLSMAGSIGESAFYRRAVTAQEIQQHYQIGTGTPPTQPDSLYDPYRDLVLSHQPDGYWRHRESHLHGLASIEGEEVLESSGNGWHGTYRAGSGTSPCDPEVEQMIAEYDSLDVNLTPICGDFADEGDTDNFLWSELNGGFAAGNPHGPWGMVTQTLKDMLEDTRANYNRGGILLTSGYRCPHGNNDVGGVANSYHVHGRAADMYSADHGGLNWKKPEFERLREAALETGTTIELTDWQEYPDDRHLHAAW